MVDKLITFESKHFVVVVVAGIFVRVLACLCLNNTYLFLCRCTLYCFSGMYSLVSSLALHACCCCCCVSNWKSSFVTLLCSIVFHCLLFFHNPYIVARCVVFCHTCYMYSLVVAMLTAVAYCSLTGFCWRGWNFDWQLRQNSVFFVLVYLEGFL